MINQLEVKVVKWDKLPGSDWDEILNSISVGEYIKTLPYKTAPNVPSLIIPVMLDPSWSHYKKLMFTKVLVQDGTFIWRRTE